MRRDSSCRLKRSNATENHGIGGEESRRMLRIFTWNLIANAKALTAALAHVSANAGATLAVLTEVPDAKLLLQADRRPHELPAFERWVEDQSKGVQVQH